MDKAIDYNKILVLLDKKLKDYCTGNKNIDDAKLFPILKAIQRTAILKQLQTGK